MSQAEVKKFELVKYRAQYLIYELLRLWKQIRIITPSTAGKAQ